MSEKLIPEHVDPFRFADQSLKLDGSVNLRDMPRLLTLLNAADNAVKVALEFGIDEQEMTFLKGHLETVLTLQCQRCLAPYSYEIISDFALGVVKTLDEANALPEHYEPAMAKDGMLGLKDLIEDEIILNLPIIPRHEPEECSVKLPLTDSGWDQNPAKNPFHVLASLKNKQRS